VTARSKLAAVVWTALAIVAGRLAIAWLNDPEQRPLLQLLLASVLFAGSLLLAWQLAPRRPPPPELKPLATAGAIVGLLAVLACVIAVLMVLRFMGDFARHF
jgi:hypothetical protein